MERSLISRGTNSQRLVTESADIDQTREYHVVQAIYSLLEFHGGRTEAGRIFSGHTSLDADEMTEEQYLECWASRKPSIQGTIQSQIDRAIYQLRGSLNARRAYP